MIRLFLFIGGLFASFSLVAQHGVNNNKGKARNYELPNSLIFENGKIVASTKAWKQRRIEMLSLFENEVYGERPPDNIKVEGKIVSTNNILRGKAILKTVKLTLSRKNKEVEFPIKMYLPNTNSSMSVFIGYRLYGSDTIILDSIISRGYGVVDIINNYIDTDIDDGFKNGANQLFPPERNNASVGTIAIWAWGLLRVMYYLQTDKKIDKAFVLGHSRNGKTALWAGANDLRFSMVISNNSGCAGAALSKRRFGETVEIINNAFPHWFCGNFKNYNNQESKLPVDQHQLIALIAPRPIYIASAAGDDWADPKGEFLSCLHASPVYKLLGMEGLPTCKMPPANTPVHGFIGYHIRSGKYDLTSYDWQQYMDFADEHFGKP